MMAKLDEFDEVRLLALDHLVAKKKKKEEKVEGIYNKRVKWKSFKVGDLVWKVILPVSC